MDLVERLGAGLDRGVLRGLERPDHFHRAVAGLWRCGGNPGQHGTGRGFGVDGVALAAAPAQSTIGPVYLHNRVAMAGHEASQAGSVAVGALHRDGTDSTKVCCPVDELAVAGQGGGHSQITQPGAENIQCNGDMGVLVSVDADDDAADRRAVRDVRDGVLLVRVGVSPPAGQADRTAMGPWGQAPIRSLLDRPVDQERSPRVGRQVKNRARSQSFEGAGRARGDVIDHRSHSTRPPVSSSVVATTSAGMSAGGAWRAPAAC